MGGRGSASGGGGSPSGRSSGSPDYKRSYEIEMENAKDFEAYFAVEPGATKEATGYQMYVHQDVTGRSLIADTRKDIDALKRDLREANAMQIYNHYRKHWLAAYFQLNGITCYPTISWSDESSYDWCWDGEPVKGIVAVSSVGTQKNKEAQRLFLKGYEEMMKRLDPTWVIFYGRVPEECDWNVIHINPHYDEIKQRYRAKQER